MAVTPGRRVVIPDQLWKALGQAVDHDPELNRSQVIRELIRWYVGETDRLPERPARP